MSSPSSTPRPSLASGSGAAERRTSALSGVDSSSSFAENPFIPSGASGVLGDKEIEPWSVKQIGINCISSAVIDPTGKYPDVVVSKNLPFVPPAVIPKTEPQHFEPYQRKISNGYPQFLKNHRISFRNFNTFLPEDATADAHGDVAAKRVGTLNKVIPPVFFGADFDMEDPNTFQAILDSDPTAAGSSTLLQENLSYYLDLVEVRLVQQVSHRSTSFFSAMDVLHDVHREISSAMLTIQRLRMKVASIDATLALGGLHVVQLRQRRANLLTVYRYVKMISDINQAKATVRLLLSQSDYANALDLSTTVQQFLETELSGLRCFASLSVEFSEMRASIEKVMKIELSSGLMKFVTGPFEGEQTQAKPQTELGVEKFEQLISPLFVGLVRVGKLEEYFENYRDALVRKIKQMIKNKAEEMIDGLSNSSVSTDLSQLLGPSEQQPQASLVQQLRELSSDSFLAVMTSIFDILLGMIEQLQRVNTQMERILRLLQRSDHEDSILFTPEVVDRVIASSQELVLSVHELAHIRCAKLLEVRKDSNMTSPLREFSKLFQRTMQFIESSEALTAKKRTLGLHGVMISQAKAYLDHFHQEKVSIMASLIENESWGQTDVPFEFQRLVDQLAAKSFGINEEEMPDTPLKEDEAGLDDGDDQENEINSPLPATAPSMESGDAAGTAPPKKFVVVAHQKFYIVTCTLMFLKFLGEYMSFLDQLPSFEPEVARRLAEIVHVFNSRTCQMILGGGALTIAGLKNIKTRHLAFASQSLGLLLLLVPNMKEKLRLRTQAKQQVFLGEFDRVLKDILDHQTEIHTKLAAVIPTRLETSKVAFRNTDWNEPSSKSNTPTQFSKALVTDVNALYKVLARYLPSPVCKSIMEHVYREINKILELEILAMQFDNQEAKDRLDVELQFLTASLQSVGDLGGLGDRLLQIARSMPLLAKRKEAPRLPEDAKKKSWFG